MAVRKLGDGLVKRRQKRVLGVFIDGVALDRATRRLNKKVDLSNLLRGVTSGTPPTVARYYTLVPNEDDSRQRSYLDAVSKAGFDVVVKRLPPKGVTKQVSIELEMAVDIVAFSKGQTVFNDTARYAPQNGISRKEKTDEAKNSRPEDENLPIRRIVTIVCPSRELSYPISLISENGVETVSADFGQFNPKDVLKSAAKWIDLSDSETIWRE